jgi:hypothetical protein
MEILTNTEFVEAGGDYKAYESHHLEDRRGDVDDMKMYCAM